MDSLLLGSPTIGSPTFKNYSLYTAIVAGKQSTANAKPPVAPKIKAVRAKVMRVNPAKPATAGFDPLAEARRQWDARWDAGDAMEAATSIMRAQQLVLAAVEEALVPFNLTFARYEALTLLSFSRRGSLPMGKMGQRLMIHAASVTNIVDRLEAQGLVKRTAHPDDRRTILCELTNDGRRIAEKAAAAVNTIEFGVGILSPAERTQLIRLVRKLRAANGDII
jgi:DNA-binding MarR family transcriptional regulator